MDLVKIAARIVTSNRTISVDNFARMNGLVDEKVSVIFPDDKGPAFSGSFLEALAAKHEIGMTEAQETFGTSSDELEIGVRLYWDASDERAWFQVMSVEGYVLPSEIVETLKQDYDLEALVEKQLESTLTDPLIISELQHGE